MTIFLLIICYNPVVYCLSVTIDASVFKDFMTELDNLLSFAYTNAEDMALVNKFYSAFLRSTLFVPVHKLSDEEQQHIEDLGESFLPLIMHVDNDPFMLTFDTYERLKNWAEGYQEEIAYVQYTGRNIVQGLGATVYLGLNYGSTYYKEFAPDEIQRLKIVVSKTQPKN
jgi:hypothetical protein